MGAVWRAHHLTLDVPCALKFILDGGDAGARSRFQQEARASARLKSRNVVQMLDHGVWRDRPYLAMELLDGEPLSTRLDREKRLSPEHTLALVRGVARALSAAMQLGIVHRDLKPDNVFIARDGGEEYAKVLDFGIAKITDRDRLRVDHRTNTGALLGTPRYMSPEQVDGTMAVDGRSDLWSLAVITYECLTGELPFDSNALGNLFMRIMTAPLPIPSQVARHLPAEFDAWWQRAADRDPERRFQTPDEWFAALEAALGARSKATFPDVARALPVHEPPRTSRESFSKTTPLLAAGPPASPAYVAVTGDPLSSPAPAPARGITLGAQVHSPGGSRPRRGATLVVVVAAVGVVVAAAATTVGLFRTEGDEGAVVAGPATRDTPAQPASAASAALDGSGSAGASPESSATPAASASPAPSVTASASASAAAATRPAPRGTPRPPVRPPPAGPLDPKVME
jgi:serine/threonine-protein kinase